jgi:CRP-like cAMP-binding protein
VVVLARYQCCRSTSAAFSRRGKFLSRRGDNVDQLCLIVDGVLEVSATSSVGKRHVVAIRIGPTDEPDSAAGLARSSATPVTV